MMIKYTPTILVLFMLVGCAPALTSRMTIVENLDPILKLEERAYRMQARVAALSYMGKISGETLLAVIYHYDVYYPYYLAASIYLTNGQLDEYKKAIKLAGVELVAIQVLIDGSIGKNRLSQSSPRDLIYER
ncbi:hypothetical protein LCGC14_2479420 [marine sediment metagenome]|uniref:Uncharacterized protein n=1 Tax=marine sediment metagenome TaxID=412755 RepID=A0A0F9B8R6_9ZZZZ